MMPKTPWTSSSKAAAIGLSSVAARPAWPQKSQSVLQHCTMRAMRIEPEEEARRCGPYFEFLSLTYCRTNEAAGGLMPAF